MTTPADSSRFASSPPSGGDLPPITITIDGPAGAGKSSVARRLAHRLGLNFLDTGAMYRAVALLALESGIPLEDASHESEVAALTTRTNISFDWEPDPSRVMVDYPVPRDVTERIRDADVTRAVSVVAAMASVRRLMVERQRAIRDRHPRLVTEGRDQGSVVFPDAQVIIYLDASPEERARRRTHQLVADGKVKAHEIDEQSVLADLIRRDELDRNRADGPLITPPDALTVDTTDLSEDEVIDVLEKLVRTNVSPAAAASLNSGN